MDILVHLRNEQKRILESIDHLINALTVNKRQAPVSGIENDSNGGSAQRHRQSPQQSPHSVAPKSLAGRSPGSDRSFKTPRANLALRIGDKKPHAPSAGPPSRQHPQLQGGVAPFAENKENSHPAVTHRMDVVEVEDSAIEMSVASYEYLKKYNLIPSTGGGTWGTGEGGGCRRRRPSGIVANGNKCIMCCANRVVVGAFGAK